MSPAAPNLATSGVSVADPADELTTPYPGLRAFKRKEASLFCGRGQHRIELLTKLEGKRFLAVVGASGSGKSSLVMAGLLPDIEDGLLLPLDPGIARVAVFRPGLNPFRSLARRLAKTLDAVDPEEVEKTLRASSAVGIVRVLERYDQPQKKEEQQQPDEEIRPIILVADQFEELFRFASLSQQEIKDEKFQKERRGVPVLDGLKNEAQAFVDLLLQAAAAPGWPIYVVLTMRSDFLHRCEAFERLPGAISASQYLCPRLRREQLAEAIQAPARFFKAVVTDDLANLILNDLQPEQDQLPVLQHLLARMWKLSGAIPQAGSVLTVADYNRERLGGVGHAIDNHGRELLGDLGRGPEPLDSAKVERFFRCLAEWDPAGTLVRRPRRVEQIAVEAGLTLKQVGRIADVFRSDDVHWLLPQLVDVAAGELAAGDVIDLTHESLLRKWAWLVKAMARERERRDTFRRLREAMEGTPWAQGAFTFTAEDWWRWPVILWSHLASAQLNFAQIFRFREALCLPQEPTEAWAERYGGSWLAARQFLSIARIRRGIAIGSMYGLVLIAVIGVVLFQKAEIERQNTDLALEDTKRVQAVQLAVRQQEALKLQESLSAARNESVRLTGEIDSSKRTIAELQDENKKLQDENARLRAAQAFAEALARKDPLFAKLKENYDKALEEARSSRPPGPSPLPASATTAVSFVAHSKAVEDLAFVSVEGRLHLVTGSTDHLVNLRALDGTLVRTLLKHDGTSIVPTDDNRVIVASVDQFLRIVSLGEGKEEKVLSLPGRLPDEGVVAGQMISGGRILFSTNKGRIGTWVPPETSAAFFPAKHKQTVTAISYLALKGWALASGDDNQATLWDVSENTPVFKHAFPTGAPVHGAGFSFDGTAALIPSGDRDVNIVALPSGKNGYLRHDRFVVAGQCSPTAPIVATAEQGGQVNLWAVDDSGGGSGRPAPTHVELSGHKRPITQLQWSPDGRFLVTADESGLVLVWQEPAKRVKGGFTQLPLVFPSHKTSVTALTISSKGEYVATGGADGTVRIVPLKPTISGPTLVDFGGPSHQRPMSSGGLALFDDSDADGDDAKFKYLFTAQEKDPKGGLDKTKPRPLVYRLKPDQFYLAARWDYSLTSRTFLRNTKVRVRNPANNKSELAQPVDWGPAPTTGSVAELSKGLADALGLKENDPVEVSVDLLGSGGESLSSAPSAQP